MGFRFRRSIRLLGGLIRLNFSGSGIGFSIGVPGARWTKKSGGGSRTTFNIPGTGISWIQEKGRGKGTHPAQRSLKGIARWMRKFTDADTALESLGWEEPPSKKEAGSNPDVVEGCRQYAHNARGVARALRKLLRDYEGDLDIKTEKQLVKLLGELDKEVRWMIEGGWIRTS